MIYDYGKLAITITTLLGLFVVIIVDKVTHQRVEGPVWALLGSTLTYVFTNGKQLVAPFTPSPMIVPNPEKAAVLLAKESEASS